MEVLDIDVGRPIVDQLRLFPAGSRARFLDDGQA